MEVSGRLGDGENKNLGQKFQFCEHCKFENITTKAKGICRECEEYMCDVCFRHHLKGKRNRTHELIDANESDLAAKICAREVSKCQQHDNKTIKFYCRIHNAVGCGDCIVLEHNACKPEYIKDLSKGVQETEDFKNMRRKLEQLDCDNKANHEKIDNNRRDCLNKHEEVLKEIRKYRKDINTYLDQAEAAIISEAIQLMSETVSLLDQLENDWKEFASKIKSLEQTLDTTVHRDNELFIQEVRNKMNIVELEQEIAKHAQGFSKVKHYDFVPDEQLCSQMKSTTKLGNLKISYPNKSEREETSVVMEMDKKTSTQTRYVAPQQPAYGQLYYGQQKRGYGGLPPFGTPKGVPQQPAYGQPDYGQQHPGYGQLHYGQQQRGYGGLALFGATKEPVVSEDLDVKQTSVVVGFRVRRTRGTSYKEAIACGDRGTVTAVGRDGSFSVRWDASGQTFSGYRVGTGYNCVLLI